MPSLIKNPSVIRKELKWLQTQKERLKHELEMVEDTIKVMTYALDHAGRR